MTEKKENGLRVRTWSDVAAVAGIFLAGFAVIMWGLKLESRLDTALEKITVLQLQIDRGILPRAEERVNKNDAAIADLRRRLEHCELK